MSIENHPNLHVINLMLKIDGALIDCLRGKGAALSMEDRLELARRLALYAEQVVDEKVNSGGMR